MTDGPIEFQFGGRLSLDLTWTLRYRAVWPTELLAAPADVIAWLSTVGLPAPVTATRRDLRHTCELREAIYRAAVTVIDGGSLDPSDCAVLNRWAAAPPPSPELGVDGSRRIVAPPGKEVAAGLSAVARDAIELLATAGDRRLRRCSGPLCSLLFHDDSRPGNRRWCATARCGNKVNTKAYRTRRREPG